MGLLWTVGLWAAAPLTAVAALGCLLFCREEPHRKLVWAWVAFAVSALLLFAGGWVLGLLGLAWRDLPGELLSVVMVVSWLALQGFTLGCLLPREMPELAPVLRGGLKLAVLACACLSMLATLTFSSIMALFTFQNNERIVSYQGQTLVETDEGFLDQEYHYYVYHGPLVRGGESLYGAQMERLPEDS